jgi:hypothetical protein
LLDIMPFPSGCDSAGLQDRFAPLLEENGVRAVFELIAADDAGRRAIDALDSRLTGWFAPYSDCTTAVDIHASIIVSADARKAETLAKSLAGCRILVFSVLLDDVSAEGFSGSYLVSPSAPRLLSPILVVLRRLIFEKPLACIDFADYSQILHPKGEMKFLQVNLPRGTSVEAATGRLAQEIRSKHGKLSHILLVGVFGEEFIDPTPPVWSGVLSTLDAAVKHVDSLSQEDGLTIFTGYLPEGGNGAAISVFFR